MHITFTGLVIGLATFLIIGICHPIVIVSEYRWTKKCWWGFAGTGLLFSGLSLFLGDLLFPLFPTGSFIVSSICGACAFSFFWCIHEVLAQEKRVLRGWFPENPAHHAYYERKRQEGGYRSCKTLASRTFHRRLPGRSRLRPHRSIHVRTLSARSPRHRPCSHLPSRMTRENGVSRGNQLDRRAYSSCFTFGSMPFRQKREVMSVKR